MGEANIYNSSNLILYASINVGDATARNIPGKREQFSAIAVSHAYLIVGNEISKETMTLNLKSVVPFLSKLKVEVVIVWRTLIKLCTGAKDVEFIFLDKK